MYKFIFKRTCILKEKNLDLVSKMVNVFEEHKGKILYNEEVTSISDLDGIKVVTTKSNHEYKCKHVICDVSKRYVYKNLIKEQYPEVNKLENARTLSMNGVVVYLGLNRNYKDLGLNNYKYYHFNNINCILNVIVNFI